MISLTNTVHRDASLGPRGLPGLSCMGHSFSPHPFHHQPPSWLALFCFFICLSICPWVPPVYSLGWDGGGWVGPGWKLKGNNSYASLEIHMTEAMKMQSVRAFCGLFRERSCHYQTVISGLAVTIHFKRSLCFPLKSNRLRGIFRLMVFGLEISKPFWSIIWDISRFPYPLS